MSESIVLRPITESDTDNIVKWRNTPEVKIKLYTQAPLTKDQHLNWLHNKVQGGYCCQFIIEIDSPDGMKPIGTIFIKNIDRINSKGEYGIFIGEADARGKGYASIATEQILQYAFGELKLNRIYLTVFSDNIAAIKAYEKAGFLHEGILKQDFLRGDGYVDVVYMGITADIWKTGR